MKFGKEFVSQMVQEWQDAYMDYNFLKSILKDILRHRQLNSRPSPGASTTTSQGPLNKRRSLYRAFSGLTSRYARNSLKREDEEVILVSAVQEEGWDHGRYQTMFLMSSDEGGEYELLFFRRLDTEFNKVLGFYKKKVVEMVAEADELSKQMNALITLRIRVERPVMGLSGTNTSIAAIGISPSPASFSVNRTRSGWTRMGAIQEVEMTSEENDKPEDRDDGTAKAADTDHKADRSEVDSSNFRPAPISVEDHVEITVQPQSPVLAAREILMSSNTDTSSTKADLRKAEELMTTAFTEFYQKLRLIKSYCFLNQLAFSKIMKKYDKITRRHASKSYLKMVDDSYLGSSDEVSRLMERVEAAFIKHFANGNRRKGMRTLRPTAKREKHRITFFLGCFTGCTLALIVGIIVALHARDLLKSPGRNQYMNTMFPLYRGNLFGFIILHMVMYAANIYFWRHYRINYPFIFGFKKGTELGYREVLLLSSGLSVLMLAGILSNLDMDMDPRTKSYEALTELVPLGLVVVVICITFCPFNIIYRSSRFFLNRCVFHCICAPFYKVTLPDFFLADQLTSQVQAFRNLEFYICYYGWGNFETRSNKCDESKLYEAFSFIVAVIPYGMRFLQCLRRLHDERDIMHGLNGLKYFSTIVAVVARTGHDLRRGVMWQIIAAASSGVAMIINTYWDLVIDWGLLRRNARNSWLRDKLAIPNTSVYFTAMVLNVILRLAWMQNILGFREAPFLHRKALIAIIAGLEIIRRGIWNIFRLENEHLHNVGKYRAFKSVPLPFNHD